MERRWVRSPAYRAMIEALVAARLEAGIGQQELAQRLGKHASWLNKIERIERRLDVLEFAAIAGALGVSPDVLMRTVVAALPTHIEL